MQVQGAAPPFPKAATRSHHSAYAHGTRTRTSRSLPITARGVCHSSEIPDSLWPWASFLTLHPNSRYTPSDAPIVVVASVDLDGLRIGEREGRKGVKGGGGGGGWM